MTEPTEWVMVKRELVERWEEVVSRANPLGWDRDLMACAEWQNAAHKILTDLVALSAAPTPPSSTGMEVVKEWWRVCESDDRTMATMMHSGDRMAAALTNMRDHAKQSDEQVRLMGEHATTQRNRAAAAESKLAEQAKEITALSHDLEVAQTQLDGALLKATAAEAELSTARERAIEECAGVADKKAEESHRCMLMRKQAGELQDAMAYLMDESVAKEIAAAVRALLAKG